MDNRPIGVFDSGVGGLTVVKELMRQLPDESIIYLGDTARVPYGTKSKETVIKFSFQCIRFLISQNIKIIVIACNTASAIALEQAKKHFDIPILGVIKAGARCAVEQTRNGKIGIIGTEATVNSRAYDEEILKIKDDVKLFSTPCPLFVSIAEEGWSDTEVARLTAEKYLLPLKQKGIDSLLMGCTHYPLLKNTIHKVMGEDVNLIDPAVGTAETVKQILKQSDALCDKSTPCRHVYYSSDNGEKFKKIANIFLDRKIGRVKKIDIEEF
ncbi:MAG: glutamate racemase [Clostridia bacterium]|nr:glutamate racemase [Clostridia bacterium]